MASKPAPVLESHFKGNPHTPLYTVGFTVLCCVARSCWQLGSLSHFINAEASGYIPLPGHPAEPPDPSVRDVEVSDPLSLPLLPFSLSSLGGWVLWSTKVWQQEKEGVILRGF